MRDAPTRRISARHAPAGRVATGHAPDPAG